MLECLDHASKATVNIAFRVFQHGVLAKVSTHSKSYAIRQNKLAQTIKSFIMVLFGNQELSKDVLHKSVNFIASDSEIQVRGLFGGRNYAVGFLKTLFRRGLGLRDGIRELEGRFMDEDEKDLLLVVLDSIESKESAKITIQAPRKPGQKAAETALTDV